MTQRVQLAIKNKKLCRDVNFVHILTKSVDNLKARKNKNKIFQKLERDTSYRGLLIIARFIRYNV